MGRRIVVGLWFASALLALFSSRGRANDADNRVRHYAVVVTGPAFSKGLDASYWAVNQQIRAMLTAYGYPHAAVYCLCDQGSTRGPGILGRSTLANVRKIFAHLSTVTREGDHLLVFFVGHGSPSGQDFIYVLNGGPLTSTELRTLLEGLPCQDVTVLLSPCFSGGFIPKLSAAGRVICTSTNDAEVNATAWAESFTAAIHPRKASAKTAGKPNHRISIKEAYNAALGVTIKRYEGKTKEHPLLDDNGDGVGHFGKAAIVNGDGELAANRFLGDEGRRLQIAAEAIDNLRRLNAGLVLTNPARVQRVFAAESVSLGKLGGYEHDVGANSTVEEEHLGWAQRQPSHIVAENLVKKYLIQFDRQAGDGRASAEHFYAEASARMASYGINMGELSASGTRVAAYLDWAKGQTDVKLRQHLEARVRALLVGASEPIKGSRSEPREARGND